MEETFKIGDWVVVIKTFGVDEKIGIKVGDKYEVTRVKDGVVHVLVAGAKAIWAAYDYQLKKVEPTKEKNEGKIKGNEVFKAVIHDKVDADAMSAWLYNYQFKEVETKEEKTKKRVASNHYHKDNNGNDVWQFIDDNLSKERVKGFHQGNALKYITRYNSKHNTSSGRIEDLEKAKVYIDKLIELESE